MSRPVTVDLELSHLSEENRWEGSDAEEYIKTLEVEVGRLRETEKELREITHRLKDDNANYFSRNLELEQERDQMEARLEHLQRFLASGILYTYAELIRHDAEVIERMLSNMCHQKGMTVSHYKCAELMQWMRGYVEQLRQKAKEVKQ